MGRVRPNLGALSAKFGAASTTSGPLGCSTRSEAGVDQIWGGFGRVWVGSTGFWVISTKLAGGFGQISGLVSHNRGTSRSPSPPTPPFAADRRVGCGLGAGTRIRSKFEEREPFPCPWGPRRDFACMARMCPTRWRQEVQSRMSLISGFRAYPGILESVAGPRRSHGVVLRPPPPPLLRDMPVGPNLLRSRAPET